MDIPFIHKEDAHSFDDIIKGFQYAVNSAQDILAAQQLSMFGKYFNADGTAVTKSIQVSPDKTVNIPLMSLVSQNTLAIDEIEINFTTKVKSITANTLSGDRQEVNHVGVNVDMSSVSEKDNNLVRVNVKFKSVPQPESISRIIDEQNKIL